MSRHKTEPVVFHLPVAMLGILTITSGIVYGGGNCQVDADCEDGDPCTQDACVGNVCEHTPTSGCLGCPMGGSPNCHVFSDFDYLGLLSDLTVPPYGAVHADDFIPATTEIDTICVWGAYLDANAPDTEPVFTRYNCAGAVEDHFRVRVYTDGGGLPGALVAERWVPGQQVTKCEIPGTGFELVWEIPMQVFTLTFPTISLPLADRTYWLEVANDTDTPTGAPGPIRNTCYWHWAQVVRSETYGNRHGVAGTNDRPGGPPGSGYTELSERWTGTAFCLSGPSGPVSLSVPDPPVGTCCDCDGVCEENRTQAECADFWSWSFKRWTPDATCVDQGVCFRQES